MADAKSLPEKRPAPLGDGSRTGPKGAEGESPVIAEDEPPRWRRFCRRRWLVVGAVLFVILMWFLPAVVAITPLRNVILNLVLADENWRATAGQMSVSWFAPLSVGELRLRSRQESSQIAVDVLAAEKAWWRMIWDRPTLGRFTIDRPHLDLLLGDDLVGSRRRPAGKATLTAVVTGAGITLRNSRSGEPPVDLGGFNVTIRIEPGPDGRTLVVDPTELFDRQELTEKVCNRGLHLLAPVLADSARVEGQFSLRLDELRVPLDVSDQEQVAGTKLSGRLQLHRVEVGSKNALVTNLAGLISSIVKVPAPDMVRIADQTNVAFHLADGRMHHEGLAFGLPTVSQDLVFRTSGSVGLDESLDLVVEVPLAGDVLGDGPIARQLAGKRLVLHVGGTFDEPRLDLPRGDLPLQNLLAELTKGDGDEPVDAVEVAESALDIVGRLLEARREQKRGSQGPSDREPGRSQLPPPAADQNNADENDQPRRPLLRLLDRLLEPSQEGTSPPSDAP